MQKVKPDYACSTHTASSPPPAAELRRCLVRAGNGALLTQKLLCSLTDVNESADIPSAHCLGWRGGKNLRKTSDDVNHLDDHPATLLQIRYRKERIGHPDGMTIFLMDAQRCNDRRRKYIHHARIVIRHPPVQNACVHERGRHAANEIGILHGMPGDVRITIVFRRTRGPRQGRRSNPRCRQVWR